MPMTPSDLIAEWRSDELGAYNEAYDKCADDLTAILPAYLKVVIKTAIKRATRSAQSTNPIVKAPTVESVLAEANRRWKEQDK